MAGTPRLKADTFTQSVTVALLVMVVARGFAFGRGVLLARTLDPAQLGTWALIANAVQVLAFVAALGVPSGISRYAERHRQANRLRSFFTGAVWRSLAVAALACLAGVVFWEPVGSLIFGSTASRPLVVVTMAAILATVLLFILQGVMHGLRLFRLDSLFDLTQNVVFLGLAATLLFCWQNDALTAAIAHLAATVLISGAMGIWLTRTIRRADGEPTRDGSSSAAARATWWSLIAYSLGTWGAGTLQALWRVIDRYMVLHLADLSSAEALDQIGQYFIASKLGQPLTALAGVVSITLLPHAVSRWEGRQGRDAVAPMIRLAAKLTVLTLVFVGAGLILLKPWLMMIVAGRATPFALMLFAPVLATITAVSLHYVVRTYILCREKAWLIVGVWLVCLAANAALNAVLIPRYQIVGAATATMISAQVAAVLVLGLAARVGLRLDRGVWLMAVMPLVLLLPTWPMLAIVLAIGVSAVGTSLVFTATEKQTIARWCEAQLRRLQAMRRRPPAAESPT